MSILEKVFFIISFSLLGCMSKIDSQENNFYWTKNSVRSVLIDKIGVYRVELGISPQLFFFKDQTEKNKKAFQNLEFSFKNSKMINIQIDNSTNEILDAELILHK